MTCISLQREFFHPLTTHSYIDLSKDDNCQDILIVNNVDMLFLNHMPCETLSQSQQSYEIQLMISPVIIRKRLLVTISACLGLGGCCNHNATVDKESTSVNCFVFAPNMLYIAHVRSIEHFHMLVLQMITSLNIAQCLKLAISFMTEHVSTICTHTLVGNN